MTYIVLDAMADFPHIERRKGGAWQGAPVLFRTVGYCLVDDEAASAAGFARWRAALEAGAKQLTGGVRALPEQRIFVSLAGSRARPGGIDVRLTDELPAPPWTVEINEPGEAGGENGLSALAIGPDGSRVLLRQGRLQKNPQSDALIVGEAFLAATGLRPVAVNLKAGRATRDWFLVARLDGDDHSIREQTAAFVSACGAARRRGDSGATHTGLVDLFAREECADSYTTAAQPERPPAEVRRLQGEVWQALAGRCAAAGVSIRKPVHALGYEVDAELLAPEPLLIEIKTGRQANDVYEGVGQLMLYPKLIPQLSAHRRVLLLWGAPSAALKTAVKDCHVDLHSYEITDTAGPEAVVFSHAFLSHCGLH